MPRPTERRRRVTQRTVVFVDTSAWYALADAGDRWHETAARALRLAAKSHTRLITSNQVIGESYTLIRIRLGHAPAQEFLRRARASGLTERVFVADAWETEAEAILAQFADQDFSYVDATSFVVMRRLRVNAAFSFDHHFTTAGFSLIDG